jgi:hypothetical protein
MADSALLLWPSAKIRPQPFYTPSLFLASAKTAIGKRLGKQLSAGFLPQPNEAPMPFDLSFICFISFSSPQPLLHSAAREHHAWFLSLILCLRSR